MTKLWFWYLDTMQSVATMLLPKTWSKTMQLNGLVALVIAPIAILIIGVVAILYQL